MKGTKLKGPIPGTVDESGMVVADEFGSYYRIGRKFAYGKFPVGHGVGGELNQISKMPGPNSCAEVEFLSPLWNQIRPR